MVNVNVIIGALDWVGFIFFGILLEMFSYKNETY